MSLLAFLLCPLFGSLALSGVALLDATATLVCRETRCFFVNGLNCWRLLCHLQRKRIRTRSHPIFLSRPEGRVVFTVSRIDVGTSGQQRAQNPCMPTSCRENEKRYMMPCVFEIRIGAVR